MKINLNKKRGISLIVLVITILVMIILATSIILSLNSSGVIEKANKAKTDNDVSKIKEMVVVNMQEHMLEHDGQIDIYDFIDSINEDIDEQYGDNYKVTSAGNILLNGEIVNNIGMDLYKTKSEKTCTSFHGIGDIKIVVNQGTIEDDTQPNRYIITANSAPQGKKFGWWEDEYGRKVSFNPSTTAFSWDSATYTPIYVDEGDTVEKTNLYNCYSNNKVETGALYLCCKSEMLQGNTVLYRGLLYTGKKSIADSDDFVVGTSGVGMKQASNITDDPFIYTLILDSGNNTAYIRGYCVYQDSLGNVKYEYSDVISSKAGESTNFYLYNK